MLSLRRFIKYKTVLVCSPWKGKRVVYPHADTNGVNVTYILCMKAHQCKTYPWYFTVELIVYIFNVQETRPLQRRKLLRCLKFHLTVGSAVRYVTSQKRALIIYASFAPLSWQHETKTKLIDQHERKSMATFLNRLLVKHVARSQV